MCALVTGIQTCAHPISDRLHLILAIKQSIGSHHRRNGAARADHGVVRSWIKGEFGRGRCVSTDQEQQQQKLAAQYILNETAATKHHQNVKRQMQKTRVKAKSRYRSKPTRNDARNKKTKRKK